MTNEKLTVLDLFSGIGGFSLGLDRAGFRTIAFCEIEPFCQKVLQKHWPHIPIAGDINQLSYENGVLYDAGRAIYTGRIDLICGGFPCQPFSVAGRKKGTEDNRDLWPQMFRLIQQIQPSWIIGENVANFVNLAFSRTKIDLESQGYAVQPFVIPACAIGAPHRRDRVWIIANSQSQRCGGRGKGLNSDLREQPLCENQQNNRNKIRGKTPAGDELCSDASNSNSQRCQSRSDNRQERCILCDKNGDAEKTQRQGNGRKHRTCSLCDDATDSNIKRTQISSEGGFSAEQMSGSASKKRPAADSENIHAQGQLPRSRQGQSWRSGWWEIKPTICGDDDGVSNRVDRLKSLGNAVVPQIPEIIGQAILKSIEAKKS